MYYEDANNIVLNIDLEKILLQKGGDEKWYCQKN